MKKDHVSCLDPAVAGRARGCGTPARLLVIGLAVAAFGAAAIGAAGWPSASAAAGAAPGSCHADWPVAVHHAGGAAIAAPAGTALPVPCAVDTGYATSESSLAVSGGGALVYSPAQSENSMVRSLDGGASWSLTEPADEQHTSFWNTVDPWVIADRRTGRVFWAHATGPVRDEGGLPQGSGFYLAAAAGFQVYTSSDDARSWTTADYSTAPTGDWEKTFVGPPPPASSGAAQPSGYPDIVYLCANSPLEVSGPGRLCYKSLDGGATFVIAGYNSPSAGQPQDSCPPLNFNNGVVDRSGTIYIPATCQQSDYIAMSRDEGASYTWIPFKDAPTGTVVSGGYLQLAIDDADNLYAMWPANGLLYLESSRDHAASWSHALMVAAPGVSNVQRPAFAAGAAGNVGITYYAGTDPNAQRFSAYITQSRDAAAPDPTFYSAPINDPSAPIFHDYGLSGGSPRVDFIGGAYDSAGTSFWAGVVKQLGPAVNGQIATTGYVGQLDFAGAAVAPGGAALVAPGPTVPANGRKRASGCISARRLTFTINRVPGGRVVRVAVTVNRRRLLTRRGRDIRRVSFARPAGTRLVIHIVTTNNRGGKVLTTRTLRGCTRTKVSGRVRRHRRTR
jgi:hypothetical protein